jgi:hypothetical protein
MMQITATVTFSLNPDPLMMKTWDHIIWSDCLNERLADLISIEPGFGVELESLEDAEISGGSS